MAADELRRQADQFIDLANLDEEIGRDRGERAHREPRHHPKPVEHLERESLMEA